MYIKIYADGASRGNPGEAGAAAIAYDKSGDVLAKSYMKLGKATNNKAEYYGAILSLRLVEELSYRYSINEIDICMDSLLVVSQLNGKYKVKSDNLSSLHSECEILLDKIQEFSYRNIEFIHIPREENAIVDKFVNDCMNEG